MTISDQIKVIMGTTNIPSTLKAICPYIEALIKLSCEVNFPERFIGNMLKPKSYKIEKVCMAPDTAFSINGFV